MKEVMREPTNEAIAPSSPIKSVGEAILAWARNEMRGLIVPADFDKKVAEYAAVSASHDEIGCPLGIYIETLKMCTGPIVDISFEAQFIQKRDQALMFVREKNKERREAIHKENSRAPMKTRKTARAKS